MIYHAREGQASYGEAIGILLLDQSSPFIPGDVANATTYKFPVRFHKIPGFTVARAIGQDPSIYDEFLAGAEALIGQGVRAVTGDCGFMGIHQKRMAATLQVPVFLSSLLQINFISSLIGLDEKIGIITADSGSLGMPLLETVGVRSMDNLVISGMQDEPEFKAAILEESGTLDAEKIENETASIAEALVEENPDVRAILLECSMLPPYAAAVQDATELPVFDFVTMIKYVYSAVVQQRYSGYM